MMKKLLIALGMIVAASAAFAGSVPLATGPGGTNPVDPPNMVGGLNTTITNLNAAISPGSSATGANMTNTGIFTGSSFQLAAITSTGSMTLGTVRPGPNGIAASLGSLTTKFFITFTDSLGNQAYIPVWE